MLFRQKVFCGLLAVAVFTWTAAALADKPAGLSPQSLTTPAGPTSLKGLGESFSPSIATGTGSYSVAIDVPPGFLAPSLSLSYNSGSGKSEVGVGFNLPRFFIYRTTDKGLPGFDENDSFAVQGPQFNDELVLVNQSQRYYRLKNEGSFALFVRDIGGNSWRVRLPNGEDIYCGESTASRQYAGQGAYRWFANRHADRFGHEKHWHYTEDSGHVYLSEIKYQLHASVDYQNTVSFTYENRPDVFTDYTYGSADTTSQRLSRIEVLHGDRLMRTYSLTYHNEELYSLLSSVHMEGEDGLSLPTLSFEYAQHSSLGRPLVTMSTEPNTDGLINGRATLDDVNGDGLPDILYGDANNYRYYENLDGYNWSENATSLSGSPDQSLQSAETLLADINGDGFRDVVYKYGDQFRYYPAGEIVEGQFLGFEDYVPMTTYGTPNYHWGLNTVKISDLNKDGRTDMLYQPSADALKQIINDEDDVLQEANLSALPLDVVFTDPKISMTDFNGDGHLDFVKKDINYPNSSSGSRVRVWFGLGWGNYAPEQEMAYVPTGDPNEFYLQDVNKDGQADLVRVSGSWVTYYLNTGRMSFTSAKGDFYGNPTSSQSQAILFGDMNGNTTTDVVWVMNDGKIKYLDMMIAPYMGLLTKIDNGMGAVTTMTYKSSTDYMIEAKNEGAPWKTPLRTPVQVLNSLTVSDSMHLLGVDEQIAITEYLYKDGYYDGKEREFRGFARATSVELGDIYHETKLTHYHFHVGRNLETQDDEEILKGKFWQKRIENGEGELIHSMETYWEQRLLCQEDLISSTVVLPSCVGRELNENTKDELVVFAVALWTLTGHWEKTSDPRWVLQSSEMNEWGQNTSDTHWGEVLFSGERSVGGDIVLGDINTEYGSDETINETSYINDVDQWLIGLESGKVIKSISGEVLRESRNYFDGENKVGLPFGQATVGQKMRQSIWVKNSTIDTFIDAERVGYNAHGQPEQKLNANNDLHELFYDEATGSFMVEEKVYVDQLVLSYTVEVDTGTGMITQATDYNGSVTRHYYDGLARIVRVVGPLDSYELPTIDYTYSYGTSENPISTLVTEKIINHGVDNYVQYWSFSDGSGRERLQKTKYEPDGDYIASAWQAYTSRGKISSTWQNFSTNNPLFEIPPLSARVDISYYDAMDRVTQQHKRAVDGKSEQVHMQYFPLEIRTYDEQEAESGLWLYPTIQVMDGQGRQVVSTRYNDFGSGVEAVSWGIEYSAAKDITKIIDPLGYERIYSFDSRGNVTGVLDPNIGQVYSEFDAMNQVVLRVDAMGRRLEFDYGPWGRLIEDRRIHPSAPEFDEVYRYFYDTPRDASPTADYLLSRLVSVESDRVSTFYGYDQEGNQIAELRKIWDGKSELVMEERQEFLAQGSYNALGSLTQTELPGGLTAHYTRDLQGDVKSVSLWYNNTTTPIVEQIKRDARGQVKSIQLGNGVVSCFIHNSRGNLIEEKTGIGVGFDDCTASNDSWPGLYQSRAYSYTARGNIETIAYSVSDSPFDFDSQTWRFEYDKMHQLTKAEHGDDKSWTFSYDKIQNRISEAESLGPGRFEFKIMDYGSEGIGPNQLKAINQKEFEYNVSGQASYFDGNTLRYNAMGHITQVISPKGEVTEYYYDQEAKRILTRHIVNDHVVKAELKPFPSYKKQGEQHTWYIGDEKRKYAEVSQGALPPIDLNLLDRLVEEINASEIGLSAVPNEWSGVTMEEILESYWEETEIEDSQWVVKYIHTDHLGSSNLITDSTADVIFREHYKPYGASLESRGVSSGFTFAGMYKGSVVAPLNMFQSGSRFYLPEAGRWLSPDGYIIEAPELAITKLLELNGYSYATNNPINYKDPTGQHTVGERGASITRMTESSYDTRMVLSWALAPVTFGGSLIFAGIGDAVDSRDPSLGGVQPYLKKHGVAQIDPKTGTAIVADVVAKGITDTLQDGAVNAIFDDAPGWAKGTGHALTVVGMGVDMIKRSSAVAQLSLDEAMFSMAESRGMGQPIQPHYFFIYQNGPSCWGPIRGKSESERFKIVYEETTNMRVFLAGKAKQWGYDLEDGDQREAFVKAVDRHGPSLVKEYEQMRYGKE